LALDPDRLGALLHKSRLVHHEDALGVPERFGDKPDQLIPNGVGIPAGGVQQALHPLRVGLPDRLSQLPAVLALHRTQ